MKMMEMSVCCNQRMRFIVPLGCTQEFSSLTSIYNQEYFNCIDLLQNVFQNLYFFHLIISLCYLCKYICCGLVGCRKINCMFEIHAHKNSKLGALHGAVVRAGPPCAEVSVLDAAVPGSSPIPLNLCRMSSTHFSPPLDILSIVK